METIHRGVFAADAVPRQLLCAILSAPQQIPVVLLNYNGWADTRASVEQMLPNVDELWVVDNGSAVNRCSEIAALSNKIKTLRHEGNLGWAGGYNRALEVLAKLGYEAAYLLNNDAVLERGALERATETLCSDPAVAAVGSVILTDQGRRVWFDGAYHEDMSVSALEGGVRRGKTLNGAGFALSLRAFAAVGPFHEEYFLYHEEADWFSRARDAGWALLVDRDSKVHHAREGSDRNFNAYYYRARNRFLASRRGVALGDSPERWRHAFLQACRALKASEPGARLAAAEAILDGVRARFGKRPARRTGPERLARAALSLIGKWGTDLARTLAPPLGARPLATSRRG